MHLILRVSCPVCVSLRLCTCLPVCLSACLPVCLSACQLRGPRVRDDGAPGRAVGRVQLRRHPAGAADGQEAGGHEPASWPGELGHMGERGEGGG